MGSNDYSTILSKQNIMKITKLVIEPWGSRFWKLKVTPLLWHDIIKSLNCGKVSMGVVCTTYLIDEHGIIVKANDKVKTAEDQEKMLQELK